MANRRYIVRIALIVALGGFLMGFDASVISGIVKFIEPQFDLTKIQLGWAVSSLTLTATLAILITAAISMNPGLILFGILGFVASFAISIGPVQ